jgi:uncharacterized protein YhaN
LWWRISEGRRRTELLNCSGCRSADLRRTLLCHGFIAPQEAAKGGATALEQELAASLQVISKLEADLNASRSQTDDVKLAMASLEKQLENATARSVPSRA